MKMGRFGKCGVATLVALALAGIAPAQAQGTKLTDIKIALSWLRNGQYAPLMVAEAKGYFAEEGLRASFIDGGPGKNPIPTVGVGQAEFGVTSGSQLFQARAAPSPVDIVGIGAMTQTLPYAFIKLADPSDPDPVPKDLEGKTVGLQSDGSMFLEALAKRNGVDFSKIKVEIVLANAEPLLVGKVDYFSGYINNQTYQIEVEAAKPNAPANIKGKVWKAIPFSKYGVEGYGDVLFAASKTIRENPELVRKFMRAAVRGLKFVIENPDEAVKVVDAFPDQVERPDKLTWRFRIQNQLSVSADTKTSGLMWMQPRIWEATMAFYFDYKQVPRVLPVDEIMTNAFNPGLVVN
jgi:NitT/TauT family transport system substrate-binding protein